MPSSKEIKGRISSVESTLKITSAMKFVSSSKLRKAQDALAAARPYEEALRSILDALIGNSSVETEEASANLETSQPQDGPVAIVAVASNTSLCGGFNSAITGFVKSLTEKYPGAKVIPVGRKMYDAFKKTDSIERQGLMGAAEEPLPGTAEGHRPMGSADLNALSDKPSYDGAAALADELIRAFADGVYSKVVIACNRSKGIGKYIPTEEQLLPAIMGPSGGEDLPETKYIFEPGLEALLEDLTPKTLRFRLYTMLLDSATAEHAARVVAMQTATDNGEKLLDELRLLYNKTRQQKITAEILDLVGGTGDYGTGS